MLEYFAYKVYGVSITRHSLEEVGQTPSGLIEVEMILLWSIKMGQMTSILIIFSMISMILHIRMYESGQEWII